MTIAHSEHDEFIKRDHAEYLARSIPNGTLVLDRWYSPESLRRDLGAPGSMFLVAERRRIYVLPDRQRGGIGGQLLDAALAEFADQGLRLLTVCVERDNVIGRRFYDKMGFAEPRALTQTVQGYALALIEYRRPIP